MTTLLPGRPVSALDRTPIDRIAAIELSIRNMQQATPQTPIHSDREAYGDILTTGPRVMASPFSFGATATAGQVYSAYVGECLTETTFTAARIYCGTANSATAQIGVYTGTDLSAMTQVYASGTITLTNSTLHTATLPTPLDCMRETLLAVCLLLNTSTTAPTLAALAPLNGNLAGLTGAGTGTGFQKLGTNLSLPATANLTTGWAAIVGATAWAALA